MLFRSSTLFSEHGSNGKYALIDKEATVADYVFSVPNFNESDREKVISTINSIQNKYTSDGYIVVELTSCKSGDNSAVIDAVPKTAINITEEFKTMLGSANDKTSK